MDTEELKSNMTSGKHWLRLLFMVLFAVILYVAAFVMAVLVVLQFLFSLISGRDNRNLRALGASLAEYIFQTLRFLTYNSEDKPFPFDDWPSTDNQTPPPASRARPKTTRAKAAGKKTGAAAKTKTTARKSAASSEAGSSQTETNLDDKPGV